MPPAAELSSRLESDMRLSRERGWQSGVRIALSECCSLQVTLYSRCFDLQSGQRQLESPVNATLASQASRRAEVRGQGGCSPVEVIHENPHANLEQACRVLLVREGEQRWSAVGLAEPRAVEVAAEGEERGPAAVSRLLPCTNSSAVCSGSRRMSASGAWERDEAHFETGRRRSTGGCS